MLAYFSGSNSLKGRDIQQPIFINEIREGHFEAVKDWIRRGADVNQVTDGGVTPLMIASKKGYLEMAIMLIDVGANLMTIDDDGNNALFYAAEGGSLETVNFLTMRGLSVNSANQSGVTPLMVAAIKCRYNMIEFLLQHGADIHAKDSHGYNVLMKVIMKDTPNFDKMPIIELLERNGARLLAEDPENRLPIALLRAAQARHWRIVELLLQVGVDPNFGEYGASALKCAVKSENILIIEQLLNAGANIHEVDLGGTTFLWMGIQTRNPDVVKALLKGGANPYQSVQGATPLRQAIRNQDESIVVLLVAAMAHLEQLRKYEDGTQKSQSSPLIFTLASELERLSSQTQLRTSSKKI